MSLLSFFDKQDASVFITAGVGAIALAATSNGSWRPYILGLGALIYAAGIAVWTAHKVRESG